MAGKTEIRERVLCSARELFFRYGFNKVTTDEIAAAAGISKRTLYQHFESKERILVEVTEETARETAERAEAVMRDENRDFLGRMMGLMELRSESLSRIGKALVVDVQRHFPGLWRMVEGMRSAFLHSYLEKIVEQGMEEGFFRPDLDPKMLALVYTAAIGDIVNPESLSALPYTAREATEAVTRLIFFGALTDGARKKLAAAGRGVGGRSRTGGKKEGGR